MRKCWATRGTNFKPGDKIILCSDGLTDLVADHEILSAYRHMQIQEAMQFLINLANQRGGYDNITIIAIQVPEGIQQTKKKRSWLWGAAGIGFVVFSLLVFKTGWL